MLGGITLEVMVDMKKLPQKVASAMGAITSNEIVGASYEPFAYVGEQVVRGKNYWFLAKQRIVALESEEHIVLMAVNEYLGEYEIVKSNIIRVL